MKRKSILVMTALAAGCCWASFGPLTPSAKPYERTYEGSVPDRRLERRVAQIGGGTVFGSAAFVVDVVAALQDRFRARHVPARAVEGMGFATHGWRLAKKLHGWRFVGKEGEAWRLAEKGVEA